MTLASPRTTSRSLAPVPLDLADEALHRRTLAQALKQVQETIRKVPTKVLAITASYTMDDADALILANATSGAITVTLLTAKGRDGRRIIIKKTDASSNLVTIDAAGSELLDSSLSLGLSQKNAAREYMSDGAQWWLISEIGTATAL